MPTWILTVIKQIPTLIGVGKDIANSFKKDKPPKTPDTALTYKDIEHIRAQERSATSHKVVPGGKRKLDKENPYE